MHSVAVHLILAFLVGLAVSESDTTSVQPDPSQDGKAGKCPPIYMFDDIVNGTNETVPDDCDDGCASDVECPGIEKCCNDGCSMQCMPAIGKANRCTLT